MDFSHLNALELCLSHERAREPNALRAVWIAKIEREIAGERAFLGLPAVVASDLTDDELFAELSK